MVLKRTKPNNLKEGRPKIFTETPKTDRLGMDRLKEKQNNHLTSLKIVLWNSGGENIDKEVKIVLPDGVNIQDAKVISSLNPLNNVNIKVDPEYQNTAIISFDYLAMKEGCLISLLHTDSKGQEHQNPLIKENSDQGQERQNHLKKGTSDKGQEQQNPSIKENSN